MPELVIKSAIQNGDLTKPKTTNESISPLDHQLRKLEEVLNHQIIFGEINLLFWLGIIYLVAVLK